MTEGRAAELADEIDKYLTTREPPLGDFSDREFELIVTALREKAERDAAPKDTILPPAKGEWRTIDSAPKDGTRFIGMEGDNTPTVFWHQGFKAFVSSFRRMTMAPGYTINGEPFEDHSAVTHEPTHWMPLPAPAVVA